MKKTISLLLVVLLIFWLPAPVVYASGAEEYLNRENLTNLAKGIAALYVINRASSYLSNRDENSERDEGSEGERFDEQPEIEPSQVVDDLVIVLDPGHGGFDPGAIGPGGLKEKDVVLDITRKLADILQNSTEARVYLTRNDDT
ncbi:MAG: N-acetylmuramoyl-L-alanine amidase family protein, partial [Halanaerobiales bacterium]